MIGWGLSEVLCYLRHLEQLGEVSRLEDADPERWALAGLDGRLRARPGMRGAQGGQDRAGCR